MDFDSPDPDVEKEFPGLFASANQKKDEDECKSYLSRKFPTQQLIGYHVGGIATD